MARRKDHTHEQIRSLAIEAVLAHLQQAPANDMSLRKLAQQLGYSPGTLINVFGSYDLLLLSVNAHTLDQLAAHLPGADLASTEPAELATLEHTRLRLLALASAYLDFARQHRYQWQLLFDHRLPEDEALPVWQQQRISDLFAQLEALLAACSPRASAGECQRAARTLWASVHGICVLSLSEKLFTSEVDDGPAMLASLIQHYISAWHQAHKEC
jgi:AcrR family transcriptional regulator